MGVRAMKLILLCFAFLALSVNAAVAPFRGVLVSPGAGTKGSSASGGGVGGASITFLQKNHSTAAGPSTTSTVTLTGVSAGSLIIVGQKSEGTGEGAITGISDGTSSFTLATETEHANGDLRWCYGYLLSSVASGSVTYTVTRAASATFYWTFVMEFSYSGGSASFDTENGASGTSTAPNSGSITTGAAKTVCLGGYSHYNAVTISSMLIGGAAADGSQPTTPGSSESAMWYKILNSAGSGTASGTLSGSSEWVCRVISIKVQ